jgi:hypothetical protein
VTNPVRIRGAGAFRRALHALERAAGPLAPLWFAHHALGGLRAGLPEELTCVPSLDTALERALGGEPAPAEAARVAKLPGAPPELPALRPPRARPTAASAPWPATVGSTPPELARLAPPELRRSQPSPPSARRLPAVLAPPRAAAPAMVPLPVPGGGLAAFGDGPAVTRARSIPITPVARTVPATAAPAPGRTTPAVIAAPRPDGSGSDAPGAAHRAPLAAPPPSPPASAASPPRGLAGLATWWNEQHPAPRPPPAGALPAGGPENGDHGDAHAAAGPVASPGELAAPAHPARDALLAHAAPAIGAELDGDGAARTPRAQPTARLDDIERALEQVLVRELRRHGVAAEEP